MTTSWDDTTWRGPSTDDDPPPVRDVILRGPCAKCGEAAFGWASTDDHAGLTVTRVAEYHDARCPLLAQGGYVIAVFPRSAVQLAAHYLRSGSS